MKEIIDLFSVSRSNSAKRTALWMTSLNVSWISFLSFFTSFVFSSIMPRNTLFLPISLLPIVAAESAFRRGLDENYMPLLFMTPMGICDKNGKLMNLTEPLTVPIYLPLLHSFSSKSDTSCVSWILCVKNVVFYLYSGFGPFVVALSPADIIR